MNKNRRVIAGLTGLETAIILIAFIIVAAAFAFAVLNLGFQTAQKSGQVIQRGYEEAASAVELDGAVIAYGNTTTSKVQNVTFVIKLSAGRHPIDLSTDKLTISYWSENKYVANVYANSTAGAQVTQLVGDGDSLLEYGEKFRVTVFVTGTTINDSLGANDKFIIEVKPVAGAVLTIERYLPARIDSVMNLS
jgi:flagellin FlaB